MGTIIDATVSADQFALQKTFDRMPETEFETAPIVANDGEYALPFVWASGPDMEGLHETLQDDPSTSDVTRLVEQDEKSLYRIRWQTRIRLIVHILELEHGRLLNACGQNGQWNLRVLFPSHDSVSEIYEICQDYGIDLKIHQVKGIAQSIDRSGSDLTDKQQEALSAAIDSEYYHIPRERSLEELAADLDISHQALSERLRRGHRTLIEQTLR